MRKRPSNLMPKFPVDAPKAKVVRALQRLGFRIVREKEHFSMVRDNPDGTATPLTLPKPSDAQVFHPPYPLHSEAA